ncbi:anthrone oxygenase family protein [uncultured Hoeflea sp.]|uniref:anthrone oxygenase family protein n=1 Tax=uncultured Hoeflea sp. TaxID=538666 RepID=UPI002632387D|nr:anthrone oxygenase family protein [uncultured Hoeflea sp.]
MKTDRVLALAALLLIAAIFGFFYAWVCSTMWGLDQLDPQIAIAAMQAMNASVRNPVFFPAFFLTPLVLLASAAMLHHRHRRGSALWFAVAAAVYLVGGFGVTIAVNVPMNEALALVDATSLQTSGDPHGQAGDIWRVYSGRWQFWNQVRASACGLAVVMTGIGLIKLGQPA